MSKKEKTEVEKAKEILIEDERKRIETFNKRYRELCKEFNLQYYPPQIPREFMLGPYVPFENEK